MFGYIYINEYEKGRVYIGQHEYGKPEIDPNYDGSSKFAERYKWAPIKKTIIECCSTKEELDVAETYWIRRYRELLGVAPCVRRFYPHIAAPFVDGFVINISEGGYVLPSNKTCRKIAGSVSKLWKDSGYRERMVEAISIASKEVAKRPEQIAWKREHWTGEKNPMKNPAIVYKLSVKNGRPVVRIDKKSGVEKVYVSARQAASELGPKADQGNITRACQGKLPSAYGYYWRYA